jgi:carbon-monoxide dehydrogenase large subunit
VEDGRLVTGAARYLDDLRVPDLAHLAFVRSPHAHARVVAVDTAPARRAPGVVAVKGVGEAGTIAAPPPIVNAVVDALRPLGVGHVDMPLGAERLWRAVNPGWRERGERIEARGAAS